MWRKIASFLQRVFRKRSDPLPPEPVLPTEQLPPIEPPPTPPRPPLTPQQRERKKQLRGLVKDRQQVVEIVEHLLRILADPTLVNTKFRDDPRSEIEKLIGELMCCDFHLIDPRIKHGDEMVWFNPTHPANKDDTDDLMAMYWPIDTAVAIRHDTDFLLLRTMTVSPQEARGHVNMVFPRMVKLVHMTIYDNGKWWVGDEWAGLVNGKWTHLDQKISRESTHTMWGAHRSWHMLNTKLREELNNSVGLTFSNLLSQRYKWHVALGHEREGARLLLPSNPEGCRDFFRDRDRQGNRRAALRHWVSKHYRDTGEAGVAYVREHLRGATDFVWHALCGEVMVSEYDLERNEEFKREAEHWRATRKHNRAVRVRIKKHA